MYFEVPVSLESANQEPFIIGLSAQEKRIAEALEPVIALEGCELVQLKLAKQGARLVLTVFIDKLGAEKGIALDELQSLSHVVGDLLDVLDNAEQLFGSPYDLEMSSPGLDRPLTKASHFDAAIGQRVRLKTDARDGLPKNITAELAKADAQGAYVQVSPSSDTLLFVPYAAMQQASTVFVFEKKVPPKASKKRI